MPRRQAAEHQFHQPPDAGAGIHGVHALRQPRVGRRGVLAHALHRVAQRSKLPGKRRDRVVRVVSRQVGAPGFPARQRAVAFRHGPVEDLQRPVVVGLRREFVPAVVSVLLRVVQRAVDLLRMRADRLDHAPPHVDEALIAGDQQRVAEAVRRQGAEERLVIPAVHRSPPAAACAAADGAVQADVAGDDAAVLAGALHPRVGVLQDPVAVLGIARAQVGVQRHHRDRQVARGVAGHVLVAGAVIDVVLPGAVPAERREASLAFERIASPIEGGGPAQHRAAAAGHHAADQAVPGIVVGGAGVLVHVEAGVAAHARLIGRVPRLGQPLLEQPVEALGVVHEVEAGRELLVVHAVARQWALDGACLGVLLHVALDAVPVQVQHPFGAAKRVELGPAGDVLRGIVGAVQRAPARVAQEVAALVEVLGVELLDRLRQRGHELALKEGPMRGRHRSGQFQGGVGQRAVVHGVFLIAVGSSVRPAESPAWAAAVY